MRKLTLLLVVFLSISMIIVFSLAGCKKEATSVQETVPPKETPVEETAEEATPVEEHEVAVLFPGTVEFFSVEQKGIEAAAKEYNIKVIYADAEWDAGKQLSQVENYVAKGVDLILLCAADNEALIPAIKICNDAGIPLITFTNAVGPNPDGRYEGIVSFIGTNEVEVGRLLGEMAEKILGDSEGKIVLIEGTPGTPPQRMREKGFMEIAEKHPNWQIVYSQPIEGWTKEGSLAMMEDFIQTKKEFNLVSCQWAVAAVAAATALEEAGLIDKVAVTGIEFTKESLPYLKEGKIDMLSYYSIEDTGYKAMETAAKYLMGEEVPEFVEVKHEIVTPENVDQFTPEL